MPRIFRIVTLVALTLMPAVALAQTTVRVTVDGATLWRAGFGSVITVVAENTELEVVGRQGDWLEVVVPAGSSQDRRTGFISIKQVTLSGGTLPPSGTQSPGPQRPQPGTLQRPNQPPQPAEPLDTGLRAFGDVSYHFFSAQDTFKAVLDQPGGAFLGGGAEFRFPGGLFVQGSARWFRRTGERVFVLDDMVFPLGISNTITITPIAVTGGIRFRSRGVVPYVGGGIGVYRLRETSEFEDPLDRVDEEFRSYHVLAGTEWRTRSWLAAAIEVQYTLVPDTLEGGLAEIYDEHDLGGIDVRFKIVLGR